MAHYLPTEILDKIATFADDSAAVVLVTDQNILRNRLSVTKAMVEENYHVLEWFEKFDRDRLKHYRFNISIFEGVSLSMLEWFFSRSYGVLLKPITKFMYCSGIKRVHIAAMYKVPGFTTDSMDNAAGNNYYEVLKVLHHTGVTGCTTRAMDSAASAGFLHVVKFLHENRTEGCTTLAMDCAAGNGHLDIVWYLHRNRSEGCTSRAMNWAAGTGRLDVVRFLHRHRTEGCTADAMYNACSNGHRHIVDFLIKNVSKVWDTERAIGNATRRGHYHVIECFNDKWD